MTQGNGLVTEVKGSCFGVELEARGSKDPHVCVKVLIEDDEIWHEKMSFSSYWLSELIQVLVKMHKEMNDGISDGTLEREPHGGFRFPK